MFDHNCLTSPITRFEVEAVPRLLCNGECTVHWRLKGGVQSRHTQRDARMGTRCPTACMPLGKGGCAAQGGPWVGCEVVCVDMA